MSIYYSAKAVVGLRVPKDKLYTRRPARHVHHKGHFPGGKQFCPTCGCLVPPDDAYEFVPVWNEDENGEPHIAGYPLLLDPTTRELLYRSNPGQVEWVVIPAVVATDDEYWARLDTNRDVNFISFQGYDPRTSKHEIEVALEKHGLSHLWDDREFGMFAVLEAG